MRHRLKKYVSLVKAATIEMLQFRQSLIVTFIGNLLYLLLVYYLWKAIFASSTTPVINGMSFEDTMIYLVFAVAMKNFMEMWVVWGIGRDVQSGQIVVDLLKPIPYMRWRFFQGVGENVVKFFTTFLPTAVIVFVVAHGAIHIGGNAILFVISAAMSLIINYYIDFCVGLICIYTESIWGVNIMKVVVVGLLSGETIPIAFFPESIRQVVLMLPFQTIINTPIELLLHNEYDIATQLQMLGIQVFWLVAMWCISQWFYSVSIKRITVNGG